MEIQYPRTIRNPRRSSKARGVRRLRLRRTRARQSDPAALMSYPAMLMPP